jgi:hypothetical protein
MKTKNYPVVLEKTIKTLNLDILQIYSLKNFKYELQRNSVEQELIKIKALIMTFCNFRRKKFIKILLNYQ